ncbi:hypothetical protein RB195_019495 [Necator americanus]|uniref:Uncharacterized protein n=1 Tax=Necator americanus TaxID=51031 RepID=A0ABR1CG66_NECAM
MLNALEGDRQRDGAHVNVTNETCEHLGWQRRGNETSGRDAGARTSSEDGPSKNLSSLLNALCADGVPGNFVRLLDDVNQRTTAAVRTPARCTASFEVQRYAKAISAFSSLTKCLWSIPITDEVRLRFYLYAIGSDRIGDSSTTFYDDGFIAQKGTCLDGRLATFGLGLPQ